MTSTKEVLELADKLFGIALEEIAPGLAKDDHDEEVALLVDFAREFFRCGFVTGVQGTERALERIKEEVQEGPTISKLPLITRKDVS